MSAPILSTVSRWLPASHRNEDAEETEIKARAIVAVKPRTFELHEIEVPSEAPVGGAIIRVVANGLCGSDYNLYNGKLAPMSQGYPVIPGHEMVGELVLIDPLAAIRWDVGIGDRVAVKPIAPCGGCL